MPVMVIRKVYKKLTYLVVKGRINTKRIKAGTAKIKATPKQFNPFSLSALVADIVCPVAMSVDICPEMLMYIVKFKQSIKEGNGPLKKASNGSRDSKRRNGRYERESFADATMYWFTSLFIKS